jgi:D-alanyl-D-alanine dipeptidase
MIRVEDIAADPAYRHLRTLRAVPHDLRYAGRNNFAGRCLYGRLDCAWLRREAATGPGGRRRWLQAQRPGWRMPGARRAAAAARAGGDLGDVAGTPQQEYFANPERGSIHSFGMAVDVTLLDRPAGPRSRHGQRLRRDDACASHPALHDEHLASGVLNAAQVAERGWLQRAMQQGGFVGIPHEWWHFDHGDRDRVRRELPRVY